MPSSDLYERGYGETGHDFLKTSRSANNIITNPPYNCAEGFVASGIKHAHHKFAFLEGANRANTISTRTPPSRVWVFSERITFYPSGVERKGTGTTAYAWFVWDKDASDTGRDFPKSSLSCSQAPSRLAFGLTCRSQNSCDVMLRTCWCHIGSLGRVGDCAQSSFESVT